MKGLQEQQQTKKDIKQPWWTPTFTSNLSLTVLLTLITLLLFLYIVMAAFINHSSTHHFFITYLTIPLGPDFSISTKAKKCFFFLSTYLFCSCWTVNVALIVPLPGIEPNCIASVSTTSWIFVQLHFQIHVF